MTDNKDIAAFLAESNKIEGYPCRVKDYIDNDKKIRPPTLRYNLVDDSLRAWKQMEVTVYYLEIYGFKAANITLIHSEQMFNHSDLKGKDKGNFRTCPVFVGQQEAPKHIEIPELIEEYCRLFNEGTAHPLKLHYFFEFIHPFVDGNGRVGRLLYAMDILRRGEKLKLFLDNYIREGACRGDIRDHPDNTFDQKRYRYYRAIKDFKEEYLFGAKHEEWWEEF